MWIVEHWQGIALTISEVAALFSVKYSGIVKTVVNAISQIIADLNTNGTPKS